MKKTRLQNISDMIYRSLCEIQEIQEEQVHILFDGLIDLIQEGDKVKMPDESKALFRWLQDMWQYRDFGELSQEASFLMGSIWGAMKIIEEKRKRIAEDEDVNALINKHQSNYWLFAAVARTPGINHKNLAKRGKKSPSELSQLISRMESENLLIYSRTGREKYYYLQERGRKVYEEIKKTIEETKKRTDIMEADWVKQMARYNDSVDEEVESFVDVVVQARICINNKIYNEMYTNAGNILGVRWNDKFRNLQARHGFSGSAAGILCDNVPVFSVRDNIARFYDERAYLSKNAERYVVAER